MPAHRFLGLKLRGHTGEAAVLAEAADRPLEAGNHRWEAQRVVARTVLGGATTSRGGECWEHWWEPKALAFAMLCWVPSWVAGCYNYGGFILPVGWRRYHLGRSTVRSGLRTRCFC